VPDQRGRVAGAACVFLAACGFSAKSVIIKLAYAYDVAPATLLALRMALSLPFFAAVAWWSGRRSTQRPLTRGDWRAILTLGVLGYYLAAYLDFLGLAYIPASLERLILFLYPTLVVLLSLLLFGHRVDRRQIVALVVSYLGIGLVFGDSLRLGQDHAALVIGSALVFASGVAYAVYLIYSARVVGRIGTVRFTAYAMSVAAGVVFVQFVATHPLDDIRLPPQVYLLTLVMALVSTVIPAFLMTEGLRRVGANQAATIGTIGPVVTMALGWMLLGERITWLQALGAGLVLAGVLTVTLRRAWS
jgi:drug/metabolite transporter (DMT)-like permease